MKRIEKLVSHWPPSGRKSTFRRVNKRYVHRVMRHAAKIDPENAPTKFRFMGWASP